MWCMYECSKTERYWLLRFRLVPTVSVKSLHALYELLFVLSSMYTFRTEDVLPDVDTSCTENYHIYLPAFCKSFQWKGVLNGSLEFTSYLAIPPDLPHGSTVWSHLIVPSAMPISSPLYVIAVPGNSITNVFIGSTISWPNLEATRLLSWLPIYIECVCVLNRSL